MELQVTRKTSATFYGATKLAELRKFMAAVEGVKDTATVSFNYYRGDQRDPSSCTITVNEL